MVKRDEKVWLEDPSSIVKDLRIIPNRTMDDTTLLNVLTRLIIIMALILFVLGFRDWWLFLIAGLILICLMWFFTGKIDDSETDRRIEYYRCKRKIKETSIDRMKGSKIRSMGGRYK